MAQRDWKFHDYDIRVNGTVKVHGAHRTFPEVYSLTGLPKGSACLVYGDLTGWTRKTINAGAKGGTRYERYSDLQTALDAGITWARRKDEERARNT